MCIYIYHIYIYHVYIYIIYPTVLISPHREISPQERPPWCWSAKPMDLASELRLAGRARGKPEDFGLDGHGFVGKSNRKPSFFTINFSGEYWGFRLQFIFEPNQWILEMTEIIWGYGRGLSWLNGAVDLLHWPWLIYGEKKQPFSWGLNRDICVYIYDITTILVWFGFYSWIINQQQLRLCWGVTELGRIRWILMMKWVYLRVGYPFHRSNIIFPIRFQCLGNVPFSDKAKFVVDGATPWYTMIFRPKSIGVG